MIEPAKRVRQESLLVVDDDPLSLTTFSQGLREFGFDVREAPSADDARAQIRDRRPDLAILDIRMPGRDGIDLALEIRDSHAVPVIFLTAYSDGGLVERAVDAGALGYLVKPIDVVRALPQIEASLAQARELRSVRESQANLETALEQKRTISMAVGLVVERKQLSREAAFEWLRQRARSRRMKLEDLAAELCGHVDAVNSCLEN
jgi:response regulator NasT